MGVSPALLDRHAQLTHSLAVRLRELGSVRAGVLSARANAWEQTTHLNVSERRETCHALVADLNADAATLESEVDALRVELAHVRLLIEVDGNGER